MPNTTTTVLPKDGAATSALGMMRDLSATTCGRQDIFLFPLSSRLHACSRLFSGWCSGETGSHRTAGRQRRRSRIICRRQSEREIGFRGWLLEALTGLSRGTHPGHDRAADHRCHDSVSKRQSRKSSDEPLPGARSPIATAAHQLEDLSGESVISRSCAKASLCPKRARGANVNGGSRGR